MLQALSSETFICHFDCITFFLLDLYIIAWEIFLAIKKVNSKLVLMLLYFIIFIYKVQRELHLVRFLVIETAIL